MGREKTNETIIKTEQRENSMDDYHGRKIIIPSSPSFSKPNFHLFLFIFLISSIKTTSVSGFNLTVTPFSQAYSTLFSDFNIDPSPYDDSVRLLLNHHSGSGIISYDYYRYAFFSANIKLPSGNTAGVVVAFYASNVDTFEKNHDELDIEFLGNIRGKPWRFQTNVYGNGSTKRGREERYRLWFDPSKEFHRYSILWTPIKVIFYVDEVPIREVIRNDEMGGDFPAKPMAMYATIWDASTWATSGGKYKVDYRHEPFAAEFKDFVTDGCAVDPIQEPSATNCSETALKIAVADYFTVRPRQRKAMRWFREKYMYYSHCYDTWRYKVPLPECVIVPSEQVLFKETGRLRHAMRIKFGGSQRKQRRSRGGVRKSGGGSTVVRLRSGNEEVAAV
ncbi:hypothetical protein ACET3Z_004044 [Daucus carota]